MFAFIVCYHRVSFVVVAKDKRVFKCFYFKFKSDLSAIVFVIFYFVVV